MNFKGSSVKWGLLGVSPTYAITKKYESTFGYVRSKEYQMYQNVSKFLTFFPNDVS